MQPLLPDNFSCLFVCLFWEIDRPSSHLLIQSSNDHKTALGQVTARSWHLPPRLPRRWWKYNHVGNHCFLPGSTSTGIWRRVIHNSFKKILPGHKLGPSPTHICDLFSTCLNCFVPPFRKWKAKTGRKPWLPRDEGHWFAHGRSTEVTKKHRQSCKPEFLSTVTVPLSYVLYTSIGELWQYALLYTGQAFLSKCLHIINSFNVWAKS